MTKPDFTITVYDSTIRRDVLDEATELYREVYAEPPYLESEGDFTDFTNDLPRRAKQDSFRLVIVRLGPDPLGFAMGHQLPASTGWWLGALEPMPPEVVAEHPGRTFAIIELAVRQHHRQRGLGRRLHAHLTADLAEERRTLLVRPDAEPALTAYSRWGYRKVGQIRPFEGAPIYHAMLSALT